MTREKRLTYVDVEDFQKYFKSWLENFCYEIAREDEYQCTLYYNAMIGKEKIGIDMEVYCKWDVSETPSNGINPPESEIIMKSWDWDLLRVWHGDNLSPEWYDIVEKSLTNK